MNIEFKRLFYRTEVILFVLVLGVYAYFYQAGGWNQNSRFDLVRSIVEKGTHQIDDYYQNTGDIAKVGDHFYSDKAPGASWIGVIPYYFFYSLFGSEKADLEFLSSASYLVTVFAIAIPSALSVSMVYLFLEIFNVSVFFRIMIALGYGLGTLSLPYSTLFYGHQLGASLLIIAFTMAVRLKTQHAKPLHLLVIGILLGFAVIVEYTAVLAVVPICLYSLITLNNKKQFLYIMMGVISMGIILAAYNTIYFGTPFTLSYHFSTLPHRHSGFFMGIGRPNFTILYKILFSSYRGLFFSAPWLVFGLIGVVLLCLQKQFRSEGLVLISVITLFVWLNSSLIDWPGGWAMGARYLIPLLPFLAIGTAGLKFLPFWKNTIFYKISILILILLIGYSFFMMLVATAVKPEVPSNIMNPFKYLVPAFYRGDLALNFHSINARHPIGGGRTFAWNIGQLIGLEGLQSLFPLFLFVCVTLCWLFHINRLNVKQETE